MPKVEFLVDMDIRDLHGYWKANKDWLDGNGARFTRFRAMAYHIPLELAAGALRQAESLPSRGSKVRRQATHAWVTYLTNHRQRMDYPRYEVLGLPIGSGEVEAQCKTLVQARCKQAGIRWHTAGAESLVQVRCAMEDGRYWQEFGQWPEDLSAWQVRRKQLVRKAG